MPLQAGSTTASAEARRSYFTPRCARILYGTAQRPTRWHRFLEADGSGALGAELFIPDPEADPRAALGILHVAADGGGQADLLELLRQAAGRSREAKLLPDLDAVLGSIGKAKPDSPRFTVAFLSVTGGLDLPARTDPRLEWTPAQGWLWQLASRTNFDDFPPDPEHASEPLPGTVILSADWRAQVARDGAAFVALRPDRGAKDPFLNQGQLYAHTTYLDALLLGMIHRVSVEQLISESASAFDAPDLSRHLQRLERRVSRFRSIYWLRDASRHGPANDLLNAYQAQHSLPERFDAVLGEIADLGRTVQARESQRTSAALGVLTIVGLPIGAALEVLQALNASSLRDLAVGLAAAFSLTGIILTTRVGRLLIRQIRSLK